MNTIRSNLDSSNKLHWCIGTVKGCPDEDSREVCEKCIPAGRESIAQVIMTVLAMPDVGLKTGIIPASKTLDDTPDGDDFPEEEEPDANAGMEDQKEEENPPGPHDAE